MTQIFLNSLAIPNSCTVNKPIFKKLFFENVNLDASDKKALKDDIKKITCLFTLIPGNTGIPKYEDDLLEYQEIAILQIDLDSTNHIKKIATFINKAIPYPLILLFSFEENFAISLTNKRINQADKEKLVIEEEFLTPMINGQNLNKIQSQFINDCNIKSLSSLNFYEFYQDLVARLIAFNASNYSGTYGEINTTQTENRKVSLKKIIDLEQEISALRSDLKKESQFNRKVELNVEIKNKIEAIKKLEQNL
jgi:hypothetical protein